MIKIENLWGAIAAAAAILTAIVVVKWGRAFFKLNPQVDSPQSRTAGKLTNIQIPSRSPIPIQNFTIANEKPKNLPSEKNLISLIKLVSDKILMDKSWQFEGTFRVEGNLEERNEAKKNLYKLNPKKYQDEVANLNKDGLFATYLLKGLVRDLSDYYEPEAVSQLKETGFELLLDSVANDPVTKMPKENLAIAFLSAKPLLT